MPRSGIPAEVKARETAEASEEFDTDIARRMSLRLTTPTSRPPSSTTGMLFQPLAARVWATSDLTQVADYRGGSGGYQAIATLPDSATMVVSDIMGAISVVDLMTGAPLRSMAGATFRSATMTISHDGAVVAAPTADAAIAFWSTQSGELLATAHGHSQMITGLAFGADGTWLVSSSTDGTARRWSLQRSA